MRRRTYRGRRIVGAIAAGSVVVSTVCTAGAEGRKTVPEPGETVELPEPKYESGTSAEEALLRRRSIRRYGKEPLVLAEISQLLWAAQGITEPKRGFRTAPSAGATYPLQVYLVVRNVKGLAKGVYRYRPRRHELLRIRAGDVGDELTAAALGQECVGAGAVDVVITAVYEWTTRRYGDRGVRYVHMEAGHAAQNVYLQAVSLNLGTVAIGAFNDEKVRKTLGIPREERPLYIMPVGRIAD